MANWRQTLVRPSGSLHQLTKAVKELPKQRDLAERRQGLIRPRLITAD
jgi:hypothetical protein